MIVNAYDMSLIGDLMSNIIFESLIEYFFDNRMIPNDMLEGWSYTFAIRCLEESRIEEWYEVDAYFWIWIIKWIFCFKWKTPLGDFLG